MMAICINLLVVHADERMSGWAGWPASAIKKPLMVCLRAMNG
jgi:hypothetical protein